MICLPVKQTSQEENRLSRLICKSEGVQALGHIHPGDALLGAFDRRIDELHAT